MPSRRRIAVASTGHGGGGSIPVVGNVVWGPDFGESPTADDKTWTVKSALTMDAVDFTNERIVGCNLTMPALEFENTKPVGVHLSAEVLGAPFWQSVATNALTGNASSITVNKPAGVVEGDLMIAWIGTANSSSDVTVNTLSGWTAIGTGSLNTAGENFARGTLLRKIAGPSEPSNYTFTFSGTANQATGEIHRLNGINTTTPINTFLFATGLAAGLQPDPPAPAVTTTVTNCMIMRFLFHQHLTLPQTHTPAANNVEATDYQSTNVNIYSSSSMWRVQAAAGSTGTAAFNCTESVATDFVVATLAIQPGTLILAP